MRTYILLFDKNNTCNAGNDWTCITEYKSRKKHIELANFMLKNNKNAIKAYSITNFTQKMCEMEENELAKYVYRNGIYLCGK